MIFDKDEGPREDTTSEALRALKPAFKKDGTVTAGNAPGVNDGAAALVVTGAARAKELGVAPMVRIVAQATSGVEPKWVMMAPVGAVQKIWEKTGWKKDEVDLYELNEAFSVQALGVIRELGLDMNRVNVNGGAVALGHPIGASGARVLVTLIYEMIRRDVHRGDCGAVFGRRECGSDGGGAVRRYARRKGDKKLQLPSFWRAATILAVDTALHGGSCVLRVRPLFRDRKQRVCGTAHNLLVELLQRPTRPSRKSR